MRGSVSKGLIGCAAAIAAALACGAAQASVVTLPAQASASLDGLQFYAVPPSSAEGLAAPTSGQSLLDELNATSPPLDIAVYGPPAATRPRVIAALDQLPFVDPRAPFTPQVLAWAVLIAGMVGSRAMLRRARQLAVVEA